MNNNNRFPIVWTILLVAILGATLWSGQQVERNEALQVGGKENWKQLKKVMKSDNYKTTYTQQVEVIVQEFENPGVGDMITPGESLTDDQGNEIDIEAFLESLHDENENQEPAVEHQETTNDWAVSSITE